MLPLLDLSQFKALCLPLLIQPVAVLLHLHVVDFYLLHCVFLGFTQWVTLPLQQYQLTSHALTGLHRVLEPV